jgi:hypothetical protein
VSNLRKAVWLLREGYHRPLLRRVSRLTWDDGLAFGLAYDPRVPVRTRVPRAPVEVRPIRREDLPIFTSLTPGPRRRVDPLIRVSARQLLESGLETCYVGVTEDGPAYMQFLVTADQNNRLSDQFGGLFPPLAEDEGLLEFAFTLEDYRMRPVMPAVLLRLIEIAAEQGLNRVVTYVRPGKASFIRFFLRLGFVPFVVRVEKRRLFLRRIEFRPLDADLAARLAEPEGVEAVTKAVLAAR